MMLGPMEENAMRWNCPFVMRGLDPRIHPSSKKSFQGMDCRVKPGNDEKPAHARASAAVNLHKNP
jgi:hypothetical protein